MALDDLQTEGLFTSPVEPLFILTKEKYQDWDLGEPNGDRRENCVVSRDIVTANGNYRGWNDQNCDKLYCAVCNISSVPIFEMRG